MVYKKIFSSKLDLFWTRALFLYWLGPRLPLERDSTLVGSSIGCKCWTKTDVYDSEKSTSLLSCDISAGLHLGWLQPYVYMLD